MNSNQRKAVLLGEPFGTATSKLRKIILFELVKLVGADICFRCGLEISSIDEFSIEHIMSWQGSHNPRNAFYDISNISFSHISCNIKHGQESNPRGFIKGNIPYNKPQAPEGFLWCGKHKDFIPIKNFSKNQFRYTGYADLCRDCRSSYRSVSRS